MSAADALLHAEHITAGYGKLDILHDVSLAKIGRASCRERV